MPTRVLREGILSSHRINALTPLAELFYRRLMTVADDYGRYYASPATLRGACWPTCPDKVTEKQVAGWLEECLSGDDPLIITYTSNGNRYLQVQNFGQQTRSKSKFPEPTENNMLIKHTSTDKHLCSLDVVGVVVGDEDGQRAKTVDEVRDWYDSEFYPIFPLKKAREHGLKAARAQLKSKADRVAALAALKAQLPELLGREPSKRPYPATWINGRRWEDDLLTAAAVIDPEKLDWRNQPWVPDYT